MDEQNLDMLAEELTSCAVCTNKYFEKDDDGIMRVSLPSFSMMMIMLTFIFNLETCQL